MNIAIITVGNRDVKVEGNEFLNMGCREKGTFILDNFQQYKSKIELPIIQPFLDSLKASNITLNRFILVATDQKDGSFRKKDTLPFTKVIKKILEKDYPSSRKSFLILKENVNDYRFNYKYFQENLANIFTYNDITGLYLLPVGGMPNINSPLILVSIMLYREKVRQYCVNENAKFASLIPFNKIFLKELEKEKLITALDRFFFASVINLSSNDFVKGLASYCYHRLSFNFYKATTEINRLIEKYPDEVLSSYSDAIFTLQNDVSARTRELYFTIKIKIIQEQYVDALLRFYNLADNLLVQKVCELYHLPKQDFTCSFIKWWKKNAKKIQTEFPNIESMLEPIDGCKPVIARAGLPLYKALIRFRNSEEPLLTLIKPIFSLADLRNKSIGAHGFQGVSNEIISQKLKHYNMTLTQLLENIENYLDCPFDLSIYFKARELIKKHL